MSEDADPEPHTEGGDQCQADDDDRHGGLLADHRRRRDLHDRQQRGRVGAVAELPAASAGGFDADGVAGGEGDAGAVRGGDDDFPLQHDGERGDGAVEAGAGAGFEAHEHDTAGVAEDAAADAFKFAGAVLPGAIKQIERFEVRGTGGVGVEAVGGDDTLDSIADGGGGGVADAAVAARLSVERVLRYPPRTEAACSSARMIEVRAICAR